MDCCASAESIYRKPNQLVVIATKPVSNARRVAGNNCSRGCQGNRQVSRNSRVAAAALTHAPIRHEGIDANTTAETNGNATIKAGSESLIAASHEVGRNDAATCRWRAVPEQVAQRRPAARGGAHQEWRWQRARGRSVRTASRPLAHHGGARLRQAAARAAGLTIRGRKSALRCLSKRVS